MNPIFRTPKPTFLLLSLLLLLAQGLEAQKPYLLKDINTSTVGSNPALMTSVGDLLFFTAKDSLGRELWVTDGSQGGTRMVKDIYPGSVSSDPNFFNEVNGELLFFAHSPEHGIELWKSDGTAKGTVLVSDIAIGTENSYASNHLSLGSEMVFTCKGIDDLYGLFRTDGTASGTYQVTSQDSGLYHPGPFFEFQGKVYFNAQSDLWSYDPLSGLAEKVLDFPDQEGLPQPFGIFQGEMYFTTVLASKIYKTDGTGPGTQVVYDFGIPYGGPDQAKQGVEYNGALYFVGKTAATGYELWKTDGTSSGTHVVKDIRTGSNSSYPYRPLVLNGLLYFTASDTANGRELWRSDGTASGTQMVLDLCPGIRGGLDHNIVPFQDKLYFAGDTGEGWELMEYAPQTDQFRLLKDGKTGHSAGYPNWFAVHDDMLFFSGNSLAKGNEIWKTDGTDAGTRLIRDIATPTNGSSPRLFMGMHDKVLFFAEDGAHGFELWETDGTTAGTKLLKDIWSGPKSSLYFLKHAGNEDMVFFMADDGVHGWELWKSDGSNPGTQMVLDLWPGPEGGFTGQLSFSQDKVFFIGIDSLHQKELWVSDGTAQGTVMITDVPESSIPPGLTTHNVVRGVSTGAYFTHYYPGAGCELWFTDGTQAGTRFVKDIWPGPDFGYLNFDFSIEHNGIFYFGAKDSLNREKLWRTDGSTAGTAMVKDINPTGSADLSSPVIFNDEIYFFANVDTFGCELFRTDGTAAGTRLVKDIFPGPANGVGCANPPQLISSQGLLWFQGNDGVHGCEVWVSDGTRAGTLMLKDLHPGGSAKPLELTAFGGKVYFSARNADCTDELFESDGTAEGTHLKAVFNPGKSGEVSRLFQWHDQLFFSATTPDLVKELWTLRLASQQENPNPIPASQLLLYPSPALSQITAAWEDDHLGPYEFRIVDLLGKVLVDGSGNKTSERTELSFNVRDLAAGIYTLRITEESAKYTRKFIVVR